MLPTLISQFRVPAAANVPILVCEECYRNATSSISRLHQALEFFFPIYSQIEAHRRVRNILKDPSFSPHKIPISIDFYRLSGRGMGAASVVS